MSYFEDWLQDSFANAGSYESVGDMDAWPWWHCIRIEEWLVFRNRQGYTTAEQYATTDEAEDRFAFIEELVMTT